MVVYMSRSPDTNAKAVDFALTEAAYAIVRIFQRYPIIKLPEGGKVEQVGVEKQTVTLVLKIADGCNVVLG
jgi:hypothetical protein